MERKPKMRVILAPMQGVLDPLVRELLTQYNRYDFCVTEFVRVVDQLLPEKVFYRDCPELLLRSGKTPSGTPVRVQLLGQSPEWLAENAYRAIELGSYGIDFNCGCPSKTVNGSGGGATLLKEPELIYQAIKSIRAAIPKEEILSAKIRLGWDNKTHKFEIADAVQQAGATELTVHGRTKLDGYASQAIDWESIAQIRESINIPVIANGDIFDWKSAQKCLNVTGCEALMVARGALTIPNLSEVIKENQAPLEWASVIKILQNYLALESPLDHGYYHLGRIKQWFSYLNKHYTEAERLSPQVKKTKTIAQLSAILV